MLRFIPLVLLSFFVLNGYCARAQIETGIISPAQPAERLFLSGSTLLKGGKRLDRAIQYLALAVKKEPKNSRYNSALGLVYAARAYNLSRALALTLGYAVRMKAYEKNLAEWKVAQGDKNNFLSKISEPPAPEKEAVLDEGRVFEGRRKPHSKN